MFFVCYLQIAAMDLLCEGKYAELMKKHQAIKSHVISCVWTFVNLGALVASVSVGWTTDRFGFQPILWICAVLAAQALLPLIFEPFPNDVAENTQQGLVEVQAMQHVGNNITMTIAAGFMAALSFAYVLVALTLTHLSLVVYSLLASILFSAAVFSSMPGLVAKANLFLFLQEALHVNLSGPLERWFIASESCVPNGPKFSLTFYQTYSFTLSIISSWLAICVWHAYFKKWNIRALFKLVIVLRIVSASFDLLLILRANISLLGISDSVFYIFGNAIVMSLVSVLGFLPTVTLTSRMCPDKIEATAYAILAGGQNFGINVSKALGLWLADINNIETQEPFCNFESLPGMIVLGHMLFPALNLFLVNVLLPQGYYMESKEGSRPPSSVELQRLLDN
eukprot:Gregarina_sp_Poly_1__9980@NODE_661_length_6901_cov_53_253292_g499_i1_p4_GENE_NODE_661_length_6901_cov_53_253292_g499_i1NODE_661_length_6901_cov_53_253292_g499_i1_p4_ORF_typecomplete_len395_score35_48MFS_1/PF07690_16/0_0046MFS_1/PF07690_16/0_14MFS_4/PF06779_14/0_0003MFS_4/PF06779_14/6_3e02MFS_4/PF06779_14/4_3BT1/PF03092_16/0_00052BT1/PF03092_16/3_3e03BT1/PF03092_16/9_9e02Sugar_tr/PF00083_24/0_003Sugar_tr/PF00083_24/5_5e02Sugar_tr/PF00083_24/4_4e02Sugar_tr/PF00083_24/7_9DUF2499/PF10693_9/2DUF2499/